MNEIDARMSDLKQRGEKALIPFITAGDPDLDFTSELLDALGGLATVCELGIPYSDPVADGPVIQASYARALAGQVSIDGITGMMACRPTPAPMPVVWMVSYAIIWRRGMEVFVASARAAGVSGLIVPDLLFEESSQLRAICDRHEMALIQLVTPTTSAERARRIAEVSQGFLYYVSVTGITGTRDRLPSEIVDNVERIRQWSAVPVCVGFGISSPDQAAEVAQCADGVIVGSALVREFEQMEVDGRKGVMDRVRQKVQQLATAINGNR